MVMRINIGNCCPNCGSVWGIEEMDWQQCFCCGYPDCDDEDIEEDFDDFDDLE